MRLQLIGQLTLTKDPEGLDTLSPPSRDEGPASETVSIPRMDAMDERSRKGLVCNVAEYAVSHTSI